MGEQRVDKKWQGTGLKDYPVEAVIGTLAHYGVTVSEAGFKADAEKRYPLAFAKDWTRSWKGTGQFAPFPYAAAQYLWARWMPNKLSPTALTEVVGSLVDALAKLLDGAPDAPVGKAFKAFEELKSRIPVTDGTLDQDYVAEAFEPLPEQFLRFFDELGERLAKEGHVDDAESFAQVEETLFPERLHIATAMVKAAAGQKSDAEKALSGRADDAAAPLEARVMAVDGLIQLELHEAAVSRAESLLDVAEKAEDHHAGLALVDRLAHLYQVLGRKADLQKLEPRAEKLAEAHDKAHPHHSH